MRTCTIDLCENVVNARGLCNKHYLEFRKYGLIRPKDDRTAVIEDGYAKIPLNKYASQGYALVDIEDAWVDQYSWQNHHGYAEGIVDGKYTSMHRLLMQPPKDKQVDHINLNTTDNRRSNLRVCTWLENSRNSGRHANNTTGYKGVIVIGNRFQAQMGYLGEKLYLGLFRTPEEAARAYDAKAQELHGDFANLNFNKDES